MIYQRGRLKPSSQASKSLVIVTVIVTVIVIAIVIVTITVTVMVIVIVTVIVTVIVYMAWVSRDRLQHLRTLNPPLSICILDSIPPFSISSYSYLFPYL